jgi:membrane associated rhomboid family serine protease
VLFDVLKRNQAFSLDWWRAGMSHAGLIQEGEWWRAVTALSLHADTVHLAGNLGFGLVFGFLAGQLLGWGRAWFGMVFAGALGNALNAFVQAPSHASVGASTAVFATLGILAAYSWTRRWTRLSERQDKLAKDWR